jgi:hypothetical protein
MKSRIFYWIPRVLAIISILFMTLFSLDAFGGNESFGMKMLGFLMHNIPVLIVTAILVVAWKWEVAGGILFILSFITGTLFFHSFSGNPGSIIVIAPLLLIGILFIFHSLLYPIKKK